MPASSKEVFALRKAGLIDEAYVMALGLILDDEWNRRALAWCLYDLTKRSVTQNDYITANSYIEQLNLLNINEESDEILFKNIERVKVLADSEKQIILKAKEQSKQGNHQEALKLYKQAILKFPDDIDLNTQYAWELQKEGKLIFASDTIDVQKTKQLLSDYIKLRNERPHRLHSQFLRFANKIIDKEEFNFISFLKLWNLNNFMEEDFGGFTKDGKTYPGVAEKTIQHGAKYILDNKLNKEVDYFLPFLSIGIERFPNNIWLPFYKAKLLHFVNRNKEAIDFMIPVVKEKINAYWAWSLLAELLTESDQEKAISCYCKSLLNRGEDKFMANVRIKFAELLIVKKLWNEAKFEINYAIKIKEEGGVGISDKLREYLQTEWYKNAAEKKSNDDFYDSNKQLAEEYLLSLVPWFDGCVGESYVIPDKPDKPRRNIYIKLTEEITKVSVSERKFNALKNYKEGEAIKVKGESNREKNFLIYSVEKRDAQEIWDIFPDSVGIVDHINKEKGIAHFIVSQEIDSIIYLNQLKNKIDIGSRLLVRLNKITKGMETHYKILTCGVTQREPMENLLKDFSGEFKSIGAVGFVDDIYIENSLIEKYKIKDEVSVQGRAIINYNKKKGRWGWKAIEISETR